jgi:hypothetical protein
MIFIQIETMEDIRSLLVFINQMHAKELSELFFVCHHILRSMFTMSHFMEEFESQYNIISLLSKVL